MNRGFFHLWKNQDGRFRGKANEDGRNPIPSLENLCTNRCTTFANKLDPINKNFNFLYIYNCIAVLGLRIIDTFIGVWLEIRRTIVVFAVSA